MNYESFLECIFDMEFNPNQPDQKEKEIQTYKYILEYCNEYSLESNPETIYHEWIQLLEGNDAIILEICLEPYMRIIERSTGKIIIEHPEQRQNINIEGVK